MVRNVQKSGLEKISGVYVGLPKVGKEELLLLFRCNEFECFPFVLNIL